MKTLFFIFLIIMMVGLAGASGFSPSSLVFNLGPNQEECQIITITSNSLTINVDDKWATNSDVEWKVSLFNSSAEEHNLNINYDNSLGEEERELQVCLSGSELGEYHGVIIMKEEQQGNSVVQMGVWLKVVVAENIDKNIDKTIILGVLFILIMISFLFLIKKKSKGVSYFIKTQ